MPMPSNFMTAAQLVEKINGIEGGSELPVKVANYEGDHGMTAYTIRKFRL